MDEDRDFNDTVASNALKSELNKNDQASSSKDGATSHDILVEVNKGMDVDNVKAYIAQLVRTHRSRTREAEGTRRFQSLQ